jgi:calcineurin-like phosphoesterase family protein
MIWILGNHDKKTVKMIEKSGDIRPIRVLDSYKTNIGKYPVLISHYPYKGEGDYVDRFREKRQEDKGLPLLHGHSHRPRESKVHLSPRGTLQLDLGVDGNDFTPYSEEEVKSLIDEHYARRE